MLLEQTKQLLLFADDSCAKKDAATAVISELSPSKDIEELAPDLRTSETNSPPSFDLLRDYDLIRSRRRTLSLSIKNCRLLVRAPLRAPKYWIENTILDKKQWICAQILEQQTKQKEMLRLQHLSLLTINGETYTVCFCHQQACNTSITLNARNRRGKVILEEQRVHFKFAANVERDQCEKVAASLFVEWLKNAAPALLEERAWQLSKDLGFADQHKGLRFRMTKSAWGHCTADGIIQLNPSIILAPIFVRDYVIIHELCHLKHANHSKRFWGLVAKKCDRWREADRWLDDEGHRVTIAQHED